MADMTFRLEMIEIPNPCPVPWDSMTGGDRVRRCAQCNKNVYQLAEMTRDEAEALVRSAEGELCVQLYRRADGTVVTKDCAATPVSRSLVSFLAVASVSALVGLELNSVMRAPEANSTFSFVGGAILPPTSVGEGSQDRCESK